MIGYLFLLLAVVCTSLGQLTFKLFKNEKAKKFLYWAIMFFVATPVFSFMALKSIPLDVVYMFTSVSIVLILFFSQWILKEKVTYSQAFGAFVLIVGIIVYNT